MQTSYRWVHLAVSAGLLGLSQPGAAQSASPPTHQDSLKGKIWTATARRIWADVKPAQPRPPQWATADDFKKWVLTQKPDKSELGSLWSAVLKRVAPSQPATPAQVAGAIVSELAQRKQQKVGALTKLDIDALRADLAQVAPAPTAPTLGAAADTAATAATSPAAVAAKPRPLPQGPTPVAAPAYTSTPVAPRYLGLPPTLAGVALLLLGGLAGLGLARAMRTSRHRHHRHHSHSTPAEPDPSSIMNSQEYRKLHKQNQHLSTQLQQLRQELAALKQQLPGAPVKKAASARTPPSTAAPAPAEALSIEELVGAPAEATPAPAATRYGPVQEAPFLEERKIVDSPLPQLALMLTVNPRNPDQATFTLNPQVDQARLIGDGLTRLQKFFDYDPPLGRITAVAAVRAGKLERHASGWQVVERARLVIS